MNYEFSDTFSKLWNRNSKKVLILLKRIHKSNSFLHTQAVTGKSKYLPWDKTRPRMLNDFYYKRLVNDCCKWKLKSGILLLRIDVVGCTRVSSSIYITYCTCNNTKDFWMNNTHTPRSVQEKLVEEKQLCKWNSSALCPLARMRNRYLFTVGYRIQQRLSTRALNLLRSLACGQFLWDRGGIMCGF